MDHHTGTHPLLACAATMAAALKDVAGVEPVFMTTAEKQAALLELSRVTGQLAELRLRVLATAEDVAEETAARDAAAWLAHHARLDRSGTRRDARLATALDRRWTRVAAGLREGTVNLDQAHEIVRALDALPDDLAAEVRTQAEQRLVERAGQFGPRALRILGRRVLEVVAPEVAEEHERKRLEKEEAEAEKATFFTSRRRGDGTTDLKIRLSDAAADRLMTYLEAFTSPRRASRSDGVASDQQSDDRRPYDQRLGHAFVAFLESVDPDRMPLHGGDATTVIITLDLASLLSGLGVALVGDQPITAAEARRMACTASIIPMVLGGESEILDQGRARRLFTPAQRKAMAVRDRHCRAEACDVPAAWCEAHHANRPWSQGGRTDLSDGVLLCNWHHHRAHDHRYDTHRQPNGDLSFNRRT
ncbi:HNH endonuclease signature motif containing protein [Nocardioides sp.]|uniref:HNH endonuclease signature motif containing protein n=1 Tax=Nocardioides sp. TaxID=35761 RepID=UPI002ED2D967